ncbi:hypothetical protein CRYUN_Cryun05aG0178900 [Craigia yunnanensis]
MGESDVPHSDGAEQVNEFFEARLKSLEGNWNHPANFKVENGKILSVLKDGSRQSCPRTQPSRNSSNLPKKSKPSEEKVGKVPLNARATRSDGVVSALDDENVVLVHAKDAASGERLLTPTFEAQMSPKKALRAAMLKMKMQQEKEKLERWLHEEKTKIRAAEAAAKIKVEVELKKQRERERKAARIALQKMEKTAGVKLNLEIFMELELLCGCSLSRSPLQQLGLFIKQEYLEDEDDELILNEDVEEGEILPERL